MPKATEELLKDHRMIRKTLEGFQLDSPRFPQIAHTLQRIVLAHAWFEDTIFLPALELEPILVKLSREISQEHKDLDFLFKELRRTKPADQWGLEAYANQIRVILASHFQKEEDALFPLAERILDLEGLNNLGAEMKQRQEEVRKIFPE